MPVGGLVPRAAEDAADLIIRTAKIRAGDLARPYAGALDVRDGVMAPVLEGEDVKTSTRHFPGELNGFGATSATDAAGGFRNFPENYRAFIELAVAGPQLSVRIACHLFPQTANQEIDDLARWTEMTSPGHGCDDGREHRQAPSARERTGAPHVPRRGEAVPCAGC
jgi:predicted amidohydrolase YtcJ